MPWHQKDEKTLVLIEGGKLLATIVDNDNGNTGSTRPGAAWVLHVKAQHGIRRVNERIKLSGIAKGNLHTARIQAANMLRRFGFCDATDDAKVYPMPKPAPKPAPKKPARKRAVKKPAVKKEK